MPKVEVVCPDCGKVRSYAERTAKRLKERVKVLSSELRWFKKHVKVSRKKGK